ncbi:MAG: hypothetical protein AABY22_06150 [Nanoarchaeota archaeon]
MRRLYQFILHKEQEIEQQTESKNDAGETVITKRKEKQLTPHNFFLARPSRNLVDQCSLYNSAEVSKGLKAGLLSIYSLDRRYREEVVFTDKDNEKYKNLCESLLKLLDELQIIVKIEEKDRTEDQKSQFIKINKEISVIQNQLREFESVKNNLYNHSAEYRARNLAITWWILHLSYKEENGKESLFFSGNTLDEKLKYYDDLLDQNDPFIKQVIERFLYAVSFWVLNNADKPEDFAGLENMIEKDKVLI